MYFYPGCMVLITVFCFFQSVVDFLPRFSFFIVNWISVNNGCTKEQLLSQEGLMFDGDPASPEAIDSILSAMQIGMELAKKKNKEKYTPKKYKKD